MCGICGAFSKDRQIDKEKFDKMVDVVIHRGPDDRGIYYDGNLALGHRRLSVIDLSKDGHQPFNYKDRYFLVFNGEIYNFRVLRKRLEKQGYVFNTMTDTEVLIACYDAYGKDCVNYFNGMWSFCIFDKKMQILFCSRDRFGVKPLYYYYKNGDFFFASEIKQFWEIIDVHPKARKEKLLDFLIFGYQDFDEETFFENILQLPGGYNLSFDMKSCHLKVFQYYDLKKIKESDEGFQKACLNFKKKFVKSVRLRLSADVPVGGCLSGGLDSSSITCVAQNILNENSVSAEYHTVSSCFDDKRYDEQEYIDAVVDHAGVKSHKIFPDADDLFIDLDKIIWHMDEPFGSTSIFAQWNVFKEAKRLGLTVMLDGQGADEQLAGYSPAYQVLFTYYLRKFKFRKLCTEISAYRRLKGGSDGGSIWKVLFPSIMKAYCPKWIQKIIASIHLCRGKNGPFDIAVIYKRMRDQKPYSIHEPRQFILESMSRGMQGLLHFEDRNSMAHSIESRVVFLDVNLVESNYATPYYYKIRNGESKSIVRYGLEDYLPAKIKNRHSKLGFVTPEDQWINHNYEKFQMEFNNACEKLSEIVDTERLKKWFADNKGSIAKGDFTAWRIICVGHWIDLFGVEI